MAYTYDVSTGIGQVRLLITDTDEDNPIFQDAEIQAFLDLNNSSVKRAAAQALDTIASNETLVQKRIRLLDLSTDGPAVAAELRKHAAQLREEAEDADAETAEGLFDWAEMAVDEFTARERVIKEELRD